MPRLILMGAPGSGKGTQGELLASEFQIPRIAPGDMFRAAVKAKTALGLQVKAYSEAGVLVPDELVIAVMAERMGEPDAQQGWILDGFPRTIPQAEALEVLLQQIGQRCDRIINLAVPIPELMERLQRRAHEQNRADDTPAVIAKRLEEYHSKTFPLLEFYGDRVLEIDGTQPIEQVTANIRASLNVL
jgi:adenylate kinase